jgi:H2-forming N5,N10-methylenetetrahydromethanopterin dehydrogenase-like enzyme
VRRVPRGGPDPIRSADDALAIVALAAPFGHDTVALLLDDDRRGRAIVVVHGTVEPDALFHTIDLCLHRHDVDLGALVLATSRPGGWTVPDDVDRWVEASLQCDDAGVELLEWFVIGLDITCPRELAGDPPRW